LTAPQVRSPIVETPIAPTTPGAAATGPVALEERGTNLNENNDDHERTMDDLMLPSQKP
jgi:hypothetical protein